MEVKETLIGLVVLIALLVVFVPVISEQIATGDDQRACLTDGYEYECLDLDDGLLNWCTNETANTLKCTTNATTPILNVSTSLCTNASGVGVVNNSAISTCDSIGWASGIVAYTDTGLNATEVLLLGLATLFIVLAIVFSVVKSTISK